MALFVVGITADQEASYGLRDAGQVSTPLRGACLLIGFINPGVSLISALVHLEPSLRANLNPD